MTPRQKTRRLVECLSIAMALNAGVVAPGGYEITELMSRNLFGQGLDGSVIPLSKSVLSDVHGPIIEPELLGSSLFHCSTYGLRGGGRS